MHRLISAFLAAHLLLPALAVAQATSQPSDLRWVIAASSGRTKNLLPNHSKVADVLARVEAGDAVLMLQAPLHRFVDRPRRDLLAVRVTFAAQEVDLARVAHVLRCCGERVAFVPRDPREHLTLRLVDVPLGDLLTALALHGRITVKDPGAIDPSHTSGT